MYRFNAEDPGQSLYTPTTVGVIYTFCQNQNMADLEHLLGLLCLTRTGEEKDGGGAGGGSKCQDDVYM